MTLSPDEYRIAEDGSAIEIKKSALEGWAEHYHIVASDCFNREKYYAECDNQGREAVIKDILKLFNE